MAISSAQPKASFAVDAFGDPYDLAFLPLPRPADGYAVQQLNTDSLLDVERGVFLPMRDKQLHALFTSFAAAHAAASAWCQAQIVGLNSNTADNRTDNLLDRLPALSIVPVAYDQERCRHILIYGVLRASL